MNEMRIPGIEGSSLRWSPIGARNRETCRRSAAGPMPEHCIPSSQCQTASSQLPDLPQFSACFNEMLQFSVLK